MFPSDFQGFRYRCARETDSVGHAKPRFKGCSPKRQENVGRCRRDCGSVETVIEMFEKTKEPSAISPPPYPITLPKRTPNGRNTYARPKCINKFLAVRNPFGNKHRTHFGRRDF